MLAERLVRVPQDRHLARRQNQDSYVEEAPWVFFAQRICQLPRWYLA
jgi:hypothetical protein